MTIDMHAHWRPQVLADALRKRTKPPMVERTDKGTEVLNDGTRKIPIDGMFDDMDERLKSMDRYGITTAVLSLFGQLQWIERLPVEDSLPLCRFYNDALSALCEKHPGRFAGYASLPLANMEVAANEFIRALSLTGIVGAILPGNAFLSLANAEEYAPLMEVANDHKAVIFIHWNPRPGDQWPRVAPDIEGASPRLGTVDMQSSLSSNMITLCWTDFLERYPGAKVHIHNLGGNLPFEVERMDHRRYMDQPDLPLPSQRVKKPNLYVDCNSFGAKAIELGVDLYGSDKIMFATDGTDFSTEWTTKALAEARITDQDRRNIKHDNAARILGHLTTLAPAVAQRAAAE
jgi:predicted TIM-barrel fold metal-dependent hydrolase